VYKITFTRQAVKSIRKMPKATVAILQEKLSLVAEDPFAPQLDIIKLQGRPGYRLRIGDWRVIYEVNKDELVIIVLKIAPRGEAYR